MTTEAMSKSVQYITRELYEHHGKRALLEAKKAFSRRSGIYLFKKKLQETQSSDFAPAVRQRLLNAYLDILYRQYNETAACVYIKK